MSSIGIPLAMLLSILLPAYFEYAPIWGMLIPGLTLLALAYYCSNQQPMLEIAAFIGKFGMVMGGVFLVCYLAAKGIAAMLEKTLQNETFLLETIQTGIGSLISFGFIMMVVARRLDKTL